MPRPVNAEAGYGGLRPEHSRELSVTDANWLFVSLSARRTTCAGDRAEEAGGAAGNEGALWRLATQPPVLGRI